MPTVVTVFDMIHEKFPNYAPRTGKVARAKRTAIERASHVICISQNSCRDLLATYAVDPARVSVVTLGFSPPPWTEGTELPPLAEPYVLFVGKVVGGRCLDVRGGRRGRATRSHGDGTRLARPGGRITALENASA